MPVRVHRRGQCAGIALWSRLRCEKLAVKPNALTAICRKVNQFSETAGAGMPRCVTFRLKAVADGQTGRRAARIITPMSKSTDICPMPLSLESDLSDIGMLVRGGFHADRNNDQDEALPDDVSTVLLVGNAGAALWDVFAQHASDFPNPLDRWTKHHVDAIAADHGARALYPSDGPPYFPFQAWAKRCDTVFTSPLGILIHPEFGLWHAYRAALLFTGKLELPHRPDTASPCKTCVDRPCLSTCPVGAFDGQNYDVPLCATHIRTPAGNDCMAEGCRARRACPVGTQGYAPSQAAFHMEAFERARPRS